MINRPFPRASRYFATGFLTGMLVLAASAVRADQAMATGATIDPAKRSRTVGLDIINRTINPDKTETLEFKWSEKGTEFRRSVVASETTIVVENGKIRKLSELTDQDFRAKAVATVGADGVSVVLLRFGKAPVPKNELTPAQSALLATLAPPATASSEAALNKRVDAIVASLGLQDAAAAARLRQVLATDLRAVRDAHNAGLQVDESVKKAFLDGLAANLTPAQIEAVKNKLTNNKLPLTFKVYHQILPNLKPAADQVILGELQKAREECLEVKSVEEMNPIFKKHKTEIEHYLKDQGYDWDKAYKAFVDGQKTASR